ncbi:unnamed protein product [Phytophthora fragariaefolia]|uniref:Unnamed protein product n=1 Tax=Phytophthora fragariaefolia TaxID=1490495 RepID=A0A9W6WKB6_9STRA|nr:unnamed protein product [Phytophthora fragariaefolia]
MHSVIQRKFNEWEHGALTLRRLSADATEDIPHNAIDVFSLTIGLRMTRGGHVQASAKHRKHGRPELVRETGVLIRDNCLGQAVLSEHTIEEQRSCTLTIDGIPHSREMSHLAQSVHKGHPTRVAGLAGSGPACLLGAGRILVVDDVFFGDDVSVQRGKVTLCVATACWETPVVNLINVYFAKDVVHNLISYGLLDKRGCKLTQHPAHWTSHRRGREWRERGVRR